MNVIETTEQKELTVTAVIPEIPRISEEESQELMSSHVIGNSAKDKEIIEVTELEMVLKLLDTCKEEMYYFIGGFFRTMPDMNTFKVGTPRSEYKTAPRNRFEGKVVKYSYQSGRMDFEWATTLGNAQKKAGQEVTEIGERAFGHKVGDSTIINHTLKGTNKTRGYISWNPQRHYETYYVWVETGARLTADEVAELKTYVPTPKDGPAIYRNYRTNSIAWLNTNGKTLKIQDFPSDKDYVSKMVKEAEEIEAQKKAAKAALKAPKL